MPFRSACFPARLSQNTYPQVSDLQQLSQKAQIKAKGSSEAQLEGDAIFTPPPLLRSESRSKKLWKKVSGRRRRRTRARTLREKFYTCDELSLEQDLHLLQAVYEPFLDSDVLKEEEEDEELIEKRNEEKIKELSSLPPIHEWPGQALLRFETHSRVHGTQRLIEQSTNPHDIHNLSYNNVFSPEQIIHFETELFKGKAVFRFKGCPNEPKEYFKGRRRRQEWTIQGQFKRRVRCSQMVTGYEFKRPLVNVPAKFVVKSALKVIRKLAPTMKEEIFSDEPYCINPLLQTVQVLDVSQVGEEPNILEPFEEKNEEFLGESLKQGGRKSYFASHKNGEKHEFTPGIVYTFDFYEDKFDVSAFKLTLPVIACDVTRFLDGQPISIMSKIYDEEDADHGKYLFNFELFHQNQIPEQENRNVLLKASSSGELTTC